MTTLAATLNVVLGLAYCGLGVITVLDLRRDTKSFGFSHFGLAFVCIAFTCGPHHLIHGLHLAIEGRPGGLLDVLTVAAGIPVGVIWLTLRVEAFVGGRGDRFIPGTPGWLRAAPVAAGLYLILMLAGGASVLGTRIELTTQAQIAIATSALLIVIYIAIGWFVLRTQLTNRPSLGGWSVSGLALGAIFLTCAVMHAVFATYTVAGRYAFDLHGAVIGALSVPAGCYFLWVVRSLYRDALSDWNDGPAEVRHNGADAVLESV